MRLDRKRLPEWKSHSPPVGEHWTKRSQKIPLLWVADAAKASTVLAFRLTNEDAALVAFELTCIFENGPHLLASAVQPHLDRT